MNWTSEPSDWQGELSRDDVIQRLRDLGWPLTRLMSEIQRHVPATLVNAPIVDEAAETILVDIASVPSFFKQPSDSRLIESYLIPAISDRMNKFWFEVAEHVASVTSNFTHLRAHQDDITQDVLMALLRAGTKPYDPLRNSGTHAAFHGWIHRISRNCAIKYNDRLSREKAHNGVEGLSETPNRPTTRHPKPDLGEKILAEIGNRLTEKDRRLLRLLYIELMTVEEAAENMKISTDALHKRKQRLLLKISSLISWEDQFPDDSTLAT